MEGADTHTTQPPRLSSTARAVHNVRGDYGPLVNPFLVSLACTQSPVLRGGLSTWLPGPFATAHPEMATFPASSSPLVGRNEFSAMH